MRTSLRLLLVATLTYVGLCAYLYVAQDALLYHPTEEVSVAQAEHLFLEHDGETLKVWKTGRGAHALLYFGGNAENVAYTAASLADLVPDTTVYLPNYRGYGGSSGEPSQDGLFRDAAFLFDYVAARHDEVSLMGRSLGSGVAVHVAATRPAAKLVLVTPYDSIEEVASAAYPFAPVSLLLRDKYRAIDLVDDIAEPVLVLVADRDHVVPHGNSMALVSRFPPAQIRLRTIQNAGHNSISRSPAYLAALREFLASGDDRIRTRATDAAAQQPVT